jgi:cold shock CspA family protein
MSSFVNVDAFSVTTNNVGQRLIGRVKWFNNKAGYGFITVTDGAHSGIEVFIHHTSILVTNQRYRYLEQGEYVEFTFSATQTGDHPYSATNVTGVKNCSLLCETKNRVTSSRFNGESRGTFYEHTKYMNEYEYRPLEISIFPENEFREWKKSPMAPKGCDKNTFWENR